MNKKNRILFVLILGCSFSVVSQPISTALLEADSLFANQKFTQSFKLYDSIYHLKKASPVMLLKMAYIKEGLGDYTLAQYYLSEYYLATNNDQTLTKMEALANEKSLAGYETNDFNFILNLYFKHFQWLSIGVLVIALVLLFFFILQLKKFDQIPPVTTFFLASAVLALFVLINFGKSYNKALIIKNNTFVMAGPSAGSEVIDVIGKGNKISVNGQKDVWLLIEWDGETGYVKNNNVRLLSVW